MVPSVAIAIGVSLTSENQRSLVDDKPLGAMFFSLNVLALYSLTIKSSFPAGYANWSDILLPKIRSFD